MSYDGGAVTLTGRQAVVDFLDRAMGSDRVLTSHLVSHPEITVTGDAATGSWALQDVVVHEEHGVAIRGASY